MNENKDDKLRSLQLEAYGRLMSGLSHELKNHLAIIKESIGLLDDNLSLGHVENEATADKFKKIVTTIERRVGLAAEMSQYLSSFSHRLDSPFSSFQVNEMITEELALLYRFARLKNIAVEIELQDDLPNIYNDPSLFQFIFFKIFNYALDRFDKHGRIVVLSKKQNGNIQITLRLAGTTTIGKEPDIGRHSETLLFAVEKMGATLTTPAPENGSENVILLIKHNSLPDA